MWRLVCSLNPFSPLLPSPLPCFRDSMGTAPLVKVSLHPPLEGALQPGGTVAGTLDFRASQHAHSADPTMPKCLMVRARAACVAVFCRSTIGLSLSLIFFIFIVFLAAGTVETPCTQPCAQPCRHAVGILPPPPPFHLHTCTHATLFRTPWPGGDHAGERRARGG